MTPKPDFIIYGGDLAQLGKKEEIDLALELRAKVDSKVYYVMGEHDYYLDLGKHWESKLGPQWYSFDHKGIHFVVLNRILTYDAWSNRKWPPPMDRMLAMARLDNPGGSPFMVGEKQLGWLKKDLQKVSKTTPIIVCSYSPLQKIFKGWNFWTEDAEEVQSLLKQFDKVTVIYGHVHQIHYNQIGNTSFHAVMATAWPWPYPESYSQAPHYMPELTVRMNRADPFFERDATGWQFVNTRTGHVDMHYQLPNNQNRSVVFSAEAGKPVDTLFQAVEKRIPPTRSSRRGLSRRRDRLHRVQEGVDRGPQRVARADAPQARGTRGRPRARGADPRGGDRARPRRGRARHGGGAPRRPPLARCGAPGSGREHGGGGLRGQPAQAAAGAPGALRGAARPAPAPLPRDKVDLTDIPVAAITEQYLAYLDVMRTLNLEVAGEFLVVAATLLHIKSRLLRPVEETPEGEEGEDPRRELAQQLLEYQKFKEAGMALRGLEERRSSIFARESLGPEGPPRTDFPLEVSMFDLLTALRRVIEQMPKDI